MKRLLAVLMGGALAAGAFAQHDNSTWPTFKGNANRTASVVAPAPATNLAWTYTTPYGPSAGGITLGANGDVYYLSGEQDDANNNAPATYVFRLNSTTGAILAQSPNLGGKWGTYGGVAVGATELYVSVYVAASDPNNGIVVLDKNTLAILRQFRSSQFTGVRSTPYISDVLNNAGHRNLYVNDRNGSQMMAIDSVTGEIKWAAYIDGGAISMSQFGPVWVSGGKQIISVFGNIAFLGGYALRDNGDTTYDIVWNGGPNSFNWWGSGAMSADGTRIYVTTFNDGGADSLWAISVADGSIIWSVPSNIGTPDALNFFGRPAVLGNRVYCGGADGVMACFEDLGATYNMVWKYQDWYGEHTCTTVVKNAANETYVYTAKQTQYVPTDPNMPPPPHVGAGELLVLQDTGTSYNEIFRTDLNGTMLSSMYATSSLTVDSAGGLYMGSGWPNNAGLGPAQIYKFTVGTPVCRGDCNCDGVVDFGDINPFVAGLSGGTPCSVANCDVNGDGTVNFGDINPFVALLSGGGGPCQ